MILGWGSKKADEHSKGGGPSQSALLVSFQPLISDPHTADFVRIFYRQ
jgi:hypothetical protein